MEDPQMVSVPHMITLMILCGILVWFHHALLTLVHFFAGDFWTNEEALPRKSKQCSCGIEEDGTGSVCCACFAKGWWSSPRRLCHTLEPAKEGDLRSTGSRHCFEFR